MTLTLPRHLRRWFPLLALALLELLITFCGPGSPRTAATLFLLFFLPGWTILDAVPNAPDGILERCVLAAGLSYALTSLLTLYLLYAPGPTTQGHLLVTLNVAVAIPALMGLRRPERPRLTWPSRSELLVVGAILLLALALRAPGLGYSEFCGDELDATSLALRAIQGEDFALFVNRKGPVQTLLPAAVWLLADTMTETVTRLPFLLAGLGGVLVCYLATRGVCRHRASMALATMLVAVNGYLIAFSRMAQYQALVFFLGMLACWSVWEMHRRRQYALAVVGALFLAVALLAHFDAVVFLPAFLLVAVVAWRRNPADRAIPRWYVTAAVLIAGILFSFYVPFVRDPQFRDTLDYLLGERIGTTILHGNLDNFNALGGVYNSRLYAWILGLLLPAAVFGLTQRRRRDLVLRVPLALALWSTLLPELWTVGGTNLAVLPHIVLMLFLLGHVHDNRLAAYYTLLLSAGPFLGYVFLVAEPRTHFYITTTGVALLGGIGCDWLLQRCRGHRLRAAVLGTLVVALLLCAGYEALLFMPTEERYLALVERWPAQREARLLGALPAHDSYYTAPNRHGWKAVAALVERGELSGDFRTTGASFGAALWYSHDRLRWSRFADPQIYLAGSLESGATEHAVLPEGYALTHAIYTEGRESIRIYQRGVASTEEIRCDAEDFIRGYDAAERLSRRVAATGRQDLTPVSARIGPAITLLGYRFPPGGHIPADTLEIELVWRCEDRVDVPYRAFVHLESDRVWAQHDDDPANRLPCTLWRAGQTLTGQFRLSLPPDLPAGDYALDVGLYHPLTLERLPVRDADGAPLGDHLTLATLHAAGAME